MMAKEVPQTRRVITQEAIFDFSELYKDMKDWFDERQYKFHEKEHEQKEGAKGMELDITWIGEKEVHSYFKFKIEITILGTNIEKLQSEQGNIVYKGNLKIMIGGTLIMDYKDKFVDGKFTEFLGSIYNRIFMEKKSEEYEEKIDGEMEEIVALIKEYLQLYEDE